jgi:hypothetical protein
MQVCGKLAQAHLHTPHSTVGSTTVLSPRTLVVGANSLVPQQQQITYSGQGGQASQNRLHT